MRLANLQKEKRIMELKCDKIQNQVQVEMKAKFARLYDKCQEDQRKVLIDLDHALADHSNEL